VTISGSAQADDVEITVRDTGPGIAPDLQQQIFEFNFSQRRRGDRAGDMSARSGLGFGLWWVKTVMARLGGAVTVESDGRSGSTFRLRLPRAGTGDV
jgi:signal transduction histidine kinase